MLIDNIDKFEIFISRSEKIMDFSEKGEARLLATKVSGKLTANTNDNVSICPGMIMVFLGSHEQLDRIRVKLKDVLVKTI